MPDMKAINVIMRTHAELLAGNRGARPLWEACPTHVTLCPLLNLPVGVASSHYRPLVVY